MLTFRGLLQDFVRYLVIHRLEFNMTLQRSSNPITGVQLIPGRTCAVFRFTKTDVIGAGIYAFGFYEHYVHGGYGPLYFTHVVNVTSQTAEKLVAVGGLFKNIFIYFDGHWKFPGCG